MKQINKIYYSTDGIFLKIINETEKMLYGYPLQTTHDIKLNEETKTITMNLVPLNIKADTFEIDNIYLYKNKNGSVLGKSREWNLWNGEIYDKPNSIEKFLNSINEINEEEIK